METLEKKSWLIFGVLVILAALTIWFVQFKVAKTTVMQTPVYSAVFLDNGQVYFGNLKDNVLTNAYGVVSNASGTSQLYKITGEVHQPTDQITFNLSRILYTETLASTSPVIKAIKGN